MILNLLLSFLLLPSLNQLSIYSDSYLIFNESQVISENQPQRTYGDLLDVKITAESALAVDVASGESLYEKNSQEIRSIASITKLMTALVFLDNNPGWQKEFQTIANDRQNGGIIHLNTGDVLTIRNLFKTAMIASDNDAAGALSRSTGLSSDHFVAKMNQKARELGMTQTTFTEPTGLNKNNKSTVVDVAKLLNHALLNNELKEVTTTSYAEFEVKGEDDKSRLVKLVNTDRLVDSYLDIVGGKTGFIESAGHCLAVKVKSDQDKEIIFVVLGAKSNYDRFQDVKALADYVFTNYKW